MRCREGFDGVHEVTELPAVKKELCEYPMPRIGAAISAELNLQDLDYSLHGM